MNHKHHWAMLLLCLVPMAGLVAVYGFGLPFRSVLLVGMLLLCPLSHLWMMSRMRHGASTGARSGHEPHGIPKSLPDAAGEQASG